MKQLNLLLILLLRLSQHVVVAGSEDGAGTCDATDGGTCASESVANPESVCFPDGNCFDTLEDAESNYSNLRQGGTFFVPMEKPIPYGEAQEVGSSSEKTETLQILANTHEYMTGLFQDDSAKSFREECQVRHKQCAFWAAIGECEENPKYMQKDCAPVCKTCEHLSFEHRCPFDKDAPKVWGPGDLNKMFERLTTEDYYVQKFEPTVLSRPPVGPWVITLENVATEEECKRIIQLGADRGYERSSDVGEVKFDGTFESIVHDTRTSHNTWCLDECYEDEMHQNVLRNVENITGIPDTNSEYWQLLKYEENQYYRNHHDYIPFHLERFQGARLLTVFLYLNDVEEGGGTHFRGLDITVQPKTGRAVVWPSVLNDNPDKKDFRTSHEALPVIKGIKYGANAWVHARSFKEAFDKDCS